MVDVDVELPSNGRLLLLRVHLYQSHSPPLPPPPHTHVFTMRPIYCWNLEICD